MAITLKTDRPVKKQLSTNVLKYNRGELYSGNGLSFAVNDQIVAGDLSIDFKTVHILVNPDTTTESIIDFDGGTHVLEIVSGTVTATGFSSPTIYVDGHAGTDIVAGKWSAITVTTATAIDANNCDIGNDGATFYSGDMAGLMMYGVALTAAQVEAIYLDPAKPIAKNLLSTDLLLWLPMCENNDTVGRVFDYSGNDHHLTVSGASSVDGKSRPLLQTAIVGSSLKHWFDGTNDNISIGTLSAPTECSMSFWLLTDTFLTSKRIIQYGDINIRLATATNIYWRPDGSTNAIFTVSDYTNKLTNILITQTGTIAKLYINGVLSETLTTVSITTGSAISYISRSGTGYYKGFMDEVAIFNTAITDEAAAAIYNEGSALDLTIDSGDYINSSDLIGYWRNPDWIDLSTSGNDGTVNGSPEQFLLTSGSTTNKDGLGFPLVNAKGSGVFRGAEYAKITDNSDFDITGDLTLSAWIKLSSLGSQVHVIDRTSGYDLIISSTNKVIFGFYQTGLKFVTGATTLVADTWYHITGVYDGTNTLIYLDGVQDAKSTSYTGAIDSVSSDIYIGSLSGSSQFFDGLIDSDRVYNVALTAAQILNNYRAELSQHTN